jgi:high affinity Mn2+ porin
MFRARAWLGAASWAAMFVVVCGSAWADPGPADSQVNLASATPGAQPSSGSTQPPPAAPDAIAADQDFAIHGQTTFTEQYHPAFASPYRGPNSLNPGSRGDETWDVTLYAGYRPWKGAEIWVTPEVDQGFGLSNTVGIAGFSSGEAYKVGEAVPYVRVPQLFIRQTIDLGGETQAVAPDQMTLGGSQTADRLVLWAGKFGVVDIFDTNPYAHDPRNDFMNWAVIDGGAYDYAADAWGFTYGTAAEWYQDWWALRAGLFDGSATPNSKFLEFPLLRQFQIDLEAEARYTLLGQAGTIKLLGYQTRAKLATFSELLAFFAANPGDDYVQAERIRHLRNKFGGALNLAQPITADLGFFLRASLDDGRTEAYDFTDIDRSLSLGFSLTGKRWNRPDDTVGLAGVVNNISKARKDFLADGGLGILVGDGKLPHAGPEQIVESYYSISLVKWASVTADYQFVNHPGYNRDRGPVNILGARLHMQF